MSELLVSMPLSQQDEFGDNSENFEEHCRKHVSMPLSQQDEFGAKERWRGHWPGYRGLNAALAAR